MATESPFTRCDGGPIIPRPSTSIRRINADRTKRQRTMDHPAAARSEPLRSWAQARRRPATTTVLATQGNRRMTKRLIAFVLGGLLIGTAGCHYRSPFFPPGTVQQQRLNASVYDPYADSAAGPEVVGSRPRDYQKPWSEADRSRASIGSTFSRPVVAAPR